MSTGQMPGGPPQSCIMCDAPVPPAIGLAEVPCPRCGGLTWFEFDPDGSVAPFDRGMVMSNGVEDNAAWAALHLRGRLIIDYRTVTHLYSAILGRMVRIQQRLGPQARLKVLLHPDLYKVFQITRLDQIFDIERTR